MPEDRPDLVHVPQDLSLLSDAELAALETSAVAEFDALHALQSFTPDDLTRANTLTTDIDRVRADLAARQARAAVDAEAQRFQLEQARATLNARVHGDAPDGDGIANSSDGSPSIDVAAVAAAAAQATTESLVAAGLVQQHRGVRPSLSAARGEAPPVRVPPGNGQLAVTASVDIPGVASGANLNTLDAVVDAIHRRARALPISSAGVPDAGPRVVSIRQSFAHTVDDRTSPAQVEDLIRRLTSDDNKEALVAGGGWCAPSENLYRFFNVTCTDGLIDLPTMGVSRGGISFPESPSLADVWDGSTFDNTTNPWLWTELDDAMTVTGSTNKPCVRVPCPDYDEERLECYGICLTAGNLTDDAFPEATQNYLRLLLAAHEHAMNYRTLQLMIAGSSAVVSGADFNVDDLPVTNQVLGAVSLAAVDYRNRYGMCDSDVLEVILPMWIRDMIRSDLAWRFDVDMLAVTDQDIARMFQVRRIAPQFVGDYQVRGANQPGYSTQQTAWPDTVDFMIYAAGTWVRGNGLTLDLGVVRDSVLNAENDHTAAWSEECHLVAMMGYESRQYRVAISVRGWYENTAAAFADRI